MESIQLDITILLFTLLFSALFSGLEVAMVCANTLKVEIESQKGFYYSKIMFKIFRNLDQCITSMLVGNNICIVIYGIYSSKLILLFLFPTYLNQLNIPYWIILVQTLISTVIIILTSEFYPKLIFRIYANTLIKIFAIPIYLFHNMLKITLINYIVYQISHQFLKKFTELGTVEISKKLDSIALNKYLQYYSDRTNSSVVNDNDPEIFYLQKALNLRKLKVKDCMTPRNEITGVEKNFDFDSIKSIFVETKFSRIIVYSENIDNIIGYIHIHDVIHLQKIENHHRVDFFPESLPVEKALKKMLSRRRNMAVIINEYGGTAGILTIEDILEELVGEIEDEHDNRGELKEDKISDQEYIFSGRLEIKYLNEKYNLNLPEDEEFDTLGGLVFYTEEGIPDVGKKIFLDTFEIEILRVEQAKIDLIRLKI